MKTSGNLSSSRILASVLSGLMLTASFQPASTDWVIWFSLIPLLFALRNQPPSVCFRLGYIAGVAHFTSLMYWIIVVLGKYGGLNIALSLSIMVLLCLYLAIYIGFFGAIFSIFRHTRFGPLLTAGAWVCLEYLRGNLLTGLPWCFMGHSQVMRLHLIQICDLVGVYGLSWLAASVNVLLFEYFSDRQIWRSKTVSFQTVVVALLLLLTVLYGEMRLRETSPATKPLIRAAVIQGNIDQSEKWLPEFQKETIDTYLRLSLQAARRNPDLIIWPETAVPLFFQDPSPLSARIMKTPDSTGADLLFGSPAYVSSESGVHYTNRAYLLSRQDRAVRTYDKVHLVPFGEYVPLQRFLPFVNRLVPAAGDFVPGKQVSPLTAGPYAAGVLICYEAVFPYLARRQVKKGADILINITNDAWFGKTSAPFQHLSMSVFRAVETRLPLVRAANTGISAFVDPKGRILLQGELFQEAVLVWDIPPSEKKPTFYVRHGDILPLFLFIAISVKLLNYLIRRRHRPPPTGGKNTKKLSGR